jgi:hypothetical protein
MTNAPGYRLTQQDRPVNQVMGRSYATAQSEGAGVGAAMANLGGAVSKVGDVMEFRSRLKNDADIRVSMETLRARQRDIYFRYGQSTGANAVDGRARAEQELERARQEEAAKLSGRARDQFLAASYDLQMQRLDKVEEHAVTQERAYVTASRQATVDGLVGDALDGFEDEETFEGNLARAVEETVGLAALEGAQGPMARQAAEELVAKTVVGRAILMAERDPEAAISYLNNDPRVPEPRKAEVRQQLEPLAREQRVERMVGQFVVTQPVGEFTAMTAGAESGGGTNMQNPLSSAGGLYGYLDGTWAEHVVQAQNAGALPSEYAGMSRAELIARKKTDPKLATAVMEFDTGRYSGILRSKGLPVNPTTLYAAHHFGMGGGPAIVNEVMNGNPSMPAEALYRRNGWDWNAVVRDNPTIAYGSTVSDLYAYAGYHIGRGANIAGSSVVQYDFAAAMQFANTIEDPTERKLFIDKVAAREATTAAAITANRGATLDRVNTDFITTGNTNLTLADKLALGAEGMSAFQTFVKNTETGSFVDDVDTLGTLSRMASSGDPRTQAAFAAPGYLEQFRHLLTGDTYKRFVSARSGVEAAAEGRAFTEEQIRREPALVSQPTTAHRTQMEQTLTAIGRWTDNDRTNEQAMQAMQRRVQAAMEEIAIREGRPANDQEVRDIILAQSIPIERSLFGGVNKFMFEFDSLGDGARLDAVVNYDEIPLTDRQMIASRLQALGIANPTPEQVTTAYETAVMTRGQLAPSGFSESLGGGPPLEAISHYMLTGKGEELLQADWEEYLRGVLSGSIDPDEMPFI